MQSGSICCSARHLRVEKRRATRNVEKPSVIGLARLEQQLANRQMIGFVSVSVRSARTWENGLGHGELRLPTIIFKAIIYCFNCPRMTQGKLVKRQYNSSTAPDTAMQAAIHNQSISSPIFNIDAGLCTMGRSCFSAGCRLRRFDVFAHVLELCPSAYQG